MLCLKLMELYFPIFLSNAMTCRYFQVLLKFINTFWHSASGDDVRLHPSVCTVCEGSSALLRIRSFMQSFQEACDFQSSAVEVF